MSLEILRWTVGATYPYVIGADEAWRYELAIEAGEMTVDEVAAELLARQLIVEMGDDDMADADRTESVEVLHHHGRGAPAIGVA